jgi:hypothetical protein
LGASLDRIGNPEVRTMIRRYPASESQSIRNVVAIKPVILVVLFYDVL